MSNFAEDLKTLQYLLKKEISSFPKGKACRFKASTPSEHYCTTLHIVKGLSKFEFKTDFNESMIFLLLNLLHGLFQNLAKHQCANQLIVQILELSIKLLQYLFQTIKLHHYQAYGHAYYSIRLFPNFLHELIENQLSAWKCLLSTTKTENESIITSTITTLTHLQQEIIPTFYSQWKQQEMHYFQMSKQLSISYLTNLETDLQHFFQQHRQLQIKVVKQIIRFTTIIPTKSISIRFKILLFSNCSIWFSNQSIRTIRK
jgi:hypothetical protein